MVEPLRTYECVRACDSAHTHMHTHCPSFSPPSNDESRDRVYIFSSRRRALFTARRGYFSSSSFFAIYAGNYLSFSWRARLPSARYLEHRETSNGQLVLARANYSSRRARFVQFGYPSVVVIVGGRWPARIFRRTELEKKKERKGKKERRTRSLSTTRLDSTKEIARGACSSRAFPREGRARETFGFGGKKEGLRRRRDGRLFEGVTTNPSIILIGP